MQGNSALSSNGGAAEGEGGGLFIASVVVTLQGDTVEANSASSHGGGLFIVSGIAVYLDSFTVANTINNTDNTGLNGSTANIDGTVISPLSPICGVNAASANPNPVTGTTTNLDRPGGGRRRSNVRSPILGPSPAACQRTQRAHADLRQQQ